MDNYSETEDDFFDTREMFDQLPESNSDCSSDDCSTSGFGYDYWVGNLECVNERRGNFLKFMGLNSKWLVRDREEDDDDDEFCDEIKKDFEEVIEKNEPFLQEKIDIEDGVLCRQPSLSCWSNQEMQLVPNSVKENLKVKTLNWDESEEDTSMNKSFDFGSSSQRSSQEGVNGNLLDRRKKVKKGWLQKLSVMARIGDKDDFNYGKKPNGGGCSHAVRVHTNKKKSKELSSLYITQDFPAHNGSISIIKFSYDGRYLASAGEDAVVRIWEIFEDEDPRKYEIQETDNSSFYFSTNHLSELAPLKVNKEKGRKIKSSELACVILPPKVFRISEKPVHEFYGHSGEILSLSWSRKGFLLSSSIDKTVRLWRVGHDQCLKTFTHYNYVICAEFNPMDDNYFISGSIDGKVRIWEVNGGQVIDWIDIKEIVTAVSYYPDGKGSIVGTLDGNCSFYDIIDNRLQLDAQICVMSKKKWPRRITGFQFCPTDSRKVMVSSADSQVRILCGVNLVGKFKGNRSSGSHTLASFTSDGKHIVSAATDSNIYLWNHITSQKPLTKPKINLSFENFSSQNASIAIPWSGIKTIAAALSPRTTTATPTTPTTTRSTINSPRPSALSVNRGFFLESLLKGSPTWPAEKLPESSQVSVSPSMRKSEYKFLRSAYRSTFVAPHTWGLVIVAAGHDGRIKTYLNYGLPIRL